MYFEPSLDVTKGYTNLFENSVYLGRGKLLISSYVPMQSLVLH